VPLDKGASRELANELLKQLPEVPAALRELLTGGSEGNPFYMEELVKMLIDQGAIGTTAARWTLDGNKLLATKVPATLTGVLQARLDGLPAQEKLTLQEASVIGPVFWDQALIALDKQASHSLPSLVMRELALPRADAQLDGLREYAFRHQILHQVTYDTVLKRTKRELHAKVAQWLASLGGLRASDFLGQTAEHYERAGDNARAAEFHARAAEHANQRFAHEVVLAHVGKALALIGEETDAELHWRLLRVREQTLELQARRDEQGTDIDAMMRLADTLDNDTRRAYAAWRRSYRGMRMSDWPATESAARQGMAFAERAGDDGLRLHALRLLAVSLAHQQQVEFATSLARQGLAEARALGLRSNEAFLLNALAVISNFQDDLTAHFDLNRQILPILREIGDRRSEAIALGNQGVARLALGDLTQAEADLNNALRMLRANGDRVIESTILNNQARLALLQDDDARALALARSSLEIAVASQAPQDEAVVLLTVGEVELSLGRAAAAQQAFEQAKVRATEINDPYRFDAAAGLARVALAQGDLPAALREVETLLADAEGGPWEGVDMASLIELTCYHVLARHQDIRADEWLVRAHDTLQAQVAAIADDTMRQDFLQNIPVHREIVEIWTDWQQRKPDADGPR
jgi:tetratricopeptide (TPR) repeat protein